MLPQAAGGFNPNDSLYRSCCCHTKTFTIVTGILEIFTICFILVAIIPDVNHRLCEVRKVENGAVYYTGVTNFARNSTGLPNIVTTTASSISDRNGSEEYRENMNDVRKFMCDMNVGWLVGSILDIISINVMFYAIKSVRWILFIPHLFFRVITIGLFIMGICLEVYSIVEGGANPSSVSVGIVFTAIGGIFFVFITIAEIKCAHFVKRSQETGYSISVARPIGPATISVSDQQAQQAQTPARTALPPLRHTYGNAAQKYAE